MNSLFSRIKAGADPGFPVGGGANPVGGGADVRCGHISQNLYVKMKEFWSVGGGAPAAPPLRFANAIFYLISQRDVFLMK